MSFANRAGLLDYMVRRFSLLVADDDADIRNALGDLLERDGYRVLRAACGLEALQLAKGEDLHGLIIDMHMPDLTGLQTLKRLQDEMLRIPSILISAEPWKEMQLEAMDVGVFSFIQKPVDEGILRTSVAKLLERCGSESQLRLSIQTYRRGEIEPRRNS